MKKQITRLITISRRDLRPGQQATQASHAAIDCCFRFPFSALRWHIKSNYLINLQVSDEIHLKNFSKLLRSNGIKHVKFHEPDMNNSLTAISFFSTEKSNKLTSGLELALKDRK